MHNRYLTDVEIVHLDKNEKMNSCLLLLLLFSYQSLIKQYRQVKDRSILHSNNRDLFHDKS